MGNVTHKRAATDQAERKKQRRGRSRTGLTSIRLGEINRLLTARAGGELLPDSPDMRQAIVVVAHHLAALPRDPRRTIASWISLRAPWYSVGDLQALILETVGNPRRYRAHTLAWKLKLTSQDRAALGIKSIGCIDLTPAQRASARAENKRIARQATRRAQGAMTRAQYLAKVSKPKPWQALGISRATWFRRRARETASPA